MLTIALTHFSKHIVQCILDKRMFVEFLVLMLHLLLFLVSSPSSVLTHSISFPCSPIPNSSCLTHLFLLIPSFFPSFSSFFPILFSSSFSFYFSLSYTPIFLLCLLSFLPTSLTSHSPTFSPSL